MQFLLQNDFVLDIHKTIIESRSREFYRCYRVRVDKLKLTRLESCDFPAKMKHFSEKKWWD